MYQLLVDNIYLLLITNRASNIIEDLETLKLLSKVIPDIAGMINNLTEEKIADKCFELIFAFDEVCCHNSLCSLLNTLLILKTYISFVM